MQILMCLMSLSLSVAAGITVCQEPRIKNNLKFDDSAFTLNLQKVQGISSAYRRET